MSSTPVSPTRPDGRLLLALAWLAGFTLIDSGIVSLALPDIARDFDKPVGELAWVSTAYLLTLAATLLAAGRLNDRFGSRIVLTGGAIGFLLTTTAAGAAPSFELLVVARLAQGIFGAILYTVSLAIAVTAFPPQRRASAIGIYFTSGALGAVIGPVVGGFLTDLGGWRLVFFAQLPLPILLIVGALALLPQGGGRPVAIDVRGVASASAFVASGTFALLELGSSGGRLLALGAAAVSVLTLAAFIWTERRVSRPAVPLGIFANPTFVVATVAGAGAWFAITSSTIYPAIYLQLGRGISATDSGLILLPSPLVALAIFPFAGRLVAALGLERALQSGLGLLVAGAVLMLPWNATTPIWAVVAVSLITGLGLALTLVSSATDALSQFSPEEAGTGSAVFNSVRQLGAAMGVAIPAVIFELAAAGSRSPDAVLAGSTSAFAIRAAFLAIPLVLAVAVLRPTRAAAKALA